MTGPIEPGNDRLDDGTPVTVHQLSEHAFVYEFRIGSTDYAGMVTTAMWTSLMPDGQVPSDE